MNIDINLERGPFIGKVNSILQEFYFADSKVIMKLMNAYCCNLYGSNTWDLFSPDCQKLYRSYNVTLRTLNDLPRMTHKYLLESLVEGPHLFVQLLSRYITFAKSLLSSNSFPVRFLATMCVSDMRTVLGRTTAQTAWMLGKPNQVELLTAMEVKNRIRYAELPSSEAWRIGLIMEMKNILVHGTTNVGLSYPEVMEIIEFACIS